MTLRTRLVEVRANVLKENDKVARALRDRFEQGGTFVVSLVSSPGAGKTTLLETTLQRMRERWRVAALVGDLATDNDARRLARAARSRRQKGRKLSDWLYLGVLLLILAVALLFF